MNVSKKIHKYTQKHIIRIVIYYNNEKFSIIFKSGQIIPSLKIKLAQILCCGHFSLKFSELLHLSIFFSNNIVTIL